MRAVHSGLEQGCFVPLRSLAFLVTCLLFAGALFAQTDVVYTLTESRTAVAGSPPETESFIATVTPSPVAVVILLAGATGEIQLAAAPPDGTLGVTEANTLVRSRWLFAGHGLYTITLDAASDFYLLANGLQGYEGSSEHVADLLAVISWARTNVPGVPVWVVGVSRGTAGAFVAGLYSPGAGGPDGLVLASSINDTTDADSVLMANLAGITVPVLLINDAGNTCTGTLASGETAVKTSLTKSPKVGMELLPSAGLTALTNNCKTLSDHAFFGDEDLLAKDIALWIGSTQTQLGSGANPAAFGNPVTFTATVSYFARAGTPTGTVTFKDVTTATTLGSSPLVSGVATLTTSALSTGNHRIIAMYGGDTVSGRSNSSALVQQIH